jgi:hypothetical protein
LSEKKRSKYSKEELEKIVEKVDRQSEQLNKEIAKRRDELNKKAYDEYTVKGTLNSSAVLKDNQEVEELILKHQKLEALKKDLLEKLKKK